MNHATCTLRILTLTCLVYIQVLFFVSFQTSIIVIKHNVIRSHVIISYDLVHVTRLMHCYKKIGHTRYAVIYVECRSACFEMPIYKLDHVYCIYRYIFAMIICHWFCYCILVYNFFCCCFFADSFVQFILLLHV